MAECTSGDHLVVLVMSAIECQVLSDVLEYAWDGSDYALALSDRERSTLLTLMDALVSQRYEGE